MSDLTERLRHTASKGVSVWGDLMMEAAQEIDALRAALAQPEQTRSQQMRDAGYTRRPRQLPKEDEQEPYPLPESLYSDSKDWVASDYAGRVEWLHFMYESKTREVEQLETTLLRAAG